MINVFNKHGYKWAYKCIFEIMKISYPRLKLYKQQIRNLLAVQPKMTNQDLALKLGLHRNTIPKLLQEIHSENEVTIKKRWKFLLNEMTARASMHVQRIEKLSQRSERMGDIKATIALTKTDWMITKELYQMHLQYMGLNKTPQTLVQVNITENTG